MSARDSRAFVPNARIAMRYGLGAIAFAIAACFAGWWAILLAWIAATLAVMSAAYMWIGPAVFCKRNGYVPWWVRVGLWPHVLGLWIVRKFQARRLARAFDQIEEDIILGRLLTKCEARQLMTEHNITAVLDVCVEHAETQPLRSLNYRNIAVLDMTPPTMGQLVEAASFIADHSRSGCVYVHCGIGKSRSAAAVAAFVLKRGRASTADEAIAFVRARRPSSKFTPELREALRQFEMKIAQSSHVDDREQTARAATDPVGMS